MRVERFERGAPEAVAAAVRALVPEPASVGAGVAQIVARIRPRATPRCWA